MRSILTLYIVVFAQWASAGTLPQHSFIWDRARTLKPGENYFSIQTSHQAGSEAFDLQGNLQGLGHVSSGGQSWLEIAQNLSPSDRVQLNEFLKSEGLSGRELAFEQVYEMNQQRTEITPMWAYGLNRKWSVAARFPVTLIRTKIKYRSEQSSAFKKFMASRLQNSLVPGAHRSSETIDSHSEMGNFSLQTKQKLTEQDDFRFSWSQLLQFATAEKQQTDQLSETVTESSQYGLGLATHIDWGAQKNLWFYGSASFIKKFNESFRQEDSEGVREEIQIDAGDITEAQMTAEYNLFSSS